MPEKELIPQDRFEPRERPQFGVLVTKDHKKWDKLFQILCQIEGIPESEKIRRLIRDHIKENKDKLKSLDPSRFVIKNLYDTLNKPT